MRSNVLTARSAFHKEGTSVRTHTYCSCVWPHLDGAHLETRSLESPPLSPPTFFFKAESFTELGALLLAKLIGSNFQGSPIPASLELKTHTNTPRFLTWVLGIELRSPFLHSQHFPNSATSPAPRWGLLSDTVSKSTLNMPTFPLLLIKPKKLFCWQHQLLPSFQFFYSDESKLKVCSEFRAS